MCDESLSAVFTASNNDTVFAGGGGGGGGGASFVAKVTYSFHSLLYPPNCTLCMLGLKIVFQDALLRRN